MNTEKIRLLAKQADQYATEQNETLGVKFDTAYNNKFAELIVEECVDILAQHGVDYVEQTLNEYFEIGEREEDDE
jgi:hypothetical protein